jgi:2-polyprenyl-3-methyl-5-hydroxy-6-metoxy-1,4-benzoquinol methylase
MLDLASQERLTYESMWLVEDYAKTSPGGQLVPAFLEMSGASPGQSVLDAGCGSGKGAIALREAGFAVTMADLTSSGLLPDAEGFPFYDTCLWDDLRHRFGVSPIRSPRFGRRFDWVYCCDVLEHIPTPFVMLAVSRLLEVARYGVFLSIAMQGDNFGVWVGKPLHQTVQGFVQWRDQLAALGTVKECRDMLLNGVYLVEHR